MQWGGHKLVANWSMQYIAQWAGRESDGCMSAVGRADTSGESLQLGWALHIAQWAGRKIV